MQPLIQIPYYKKLLILVIIVLTIYIIYRLFYVRRAIISSTSATATATTAEGMTSREEFKTLENPINLLLPNYYIKSSYNSCLNGIQLSTDTLKKVLQLGYRLVDLEICQAQSNICVCANSTYKNDTADNMTNVILLNDVLTEITKTGLSNTDSSAKNYYEPLFIHLRLKNNGLDTVHLLPYYNRVADIILANLGDYLYPLVDYQGRNLDISTITLASVINSNRNCFIILDITDIGDAYLNTGLKKYIHTTSGFNIGQISLFSYENTSVPCRDNAVLNKAGCLGNTNPLVMANDGVSIKTNTITMIIPEAMSVSENHYPFDLVKNYSAQITTMNVMRNDANLKKYEDIFNIYGEGGSGGSDNMTGFMALSTVVKKSNTDVKQDLRGDIKRGIYVGVILLGVVFGMLVATRGI